MQLPAPLFKGQKRPDLALNLSGIIGQNNTTANGNNVNNSGTNNGDSRLLNNDYGSTRSSSSSDHLNNGKENNGNTMDLSRKLRLERIAVFMLDKFEINNFLFSF